MLNRQLSLNVALIALSLMLSGCVIRDHHSSDHHHPDHRPWHHEPSHAHGWHNLHGDHHHEHH